MKVFIEHRGRPAGLVLALLALLAARPGRAQLYNAGDAGAYGGVLYQGMPFANGAAGRFTNSGATITYAGPATGTFVNDGRYVALPGATDVFAGAGGSGGAQELSGAAAPTFYNLQLNNGAANFTSTNAAGLRVAGVLTFANAYTLTPRTQATNAAGAVHFLPGASYVGITSGDDAHFIDGYAMKVGSGSFTLPVGQAGDHRPVQLTEAGLPASLDSVAVAWYSGSAATTPDPSDANATHPLTSLGASVAAVSDQGFWDWVRPATSGSVPVSVSMPAQSAALAAASSLRLVGWNGTQWVALGTTGPADLTEGQALSGTVPAGITALAVGVASNPLPVELLTFSAKLKGDDGLLSWRTASERNSAYFEVQQSLDGRTWQPLGKQPAAGTTLTPRDYAYTDARLGRYGAPVIYYRLRQVDRDGTVAFSPVVTLQPVASQLFMVEVWPNPAAIGTNAQVRVTTPATTPVDITVYDAVGRRVFQQSITPGVDVALPSAAWATGAYQIRATQGERTATRRLVRE